MQYRVATAVVALVLVSLSCRDAVAPTKSLGSIGVTVAAEGIDAPDVIGISVDGGTPRQVPVLGTTWFYSLEPGRHVVTARGVPANCSLDGGADSIIVNASSVHIANAELLLRCLSASGTIAVAVSVIGRSPPVWVVIAIDNVVQPSIIGNNDAVFERYAGGQHVVSIASTPVGCGVTGSVKSQEIQLLTGKPNRDTAFVKFDVTCDSRETETGVDSRIAFQRGDVVMLIGEDGRNPVQLVEGLAPSWSPDRRFLAYEKQRCEQSWGCADDIWIIGQDGSLPHALTSIVDQMDYDPAISPDGSRIAFIRFTESADLVVASIDGGSESRISHWYPLSHPTWSPEGDRIAFTCQSTSPAVLYGLCIISSATTSCTVFNLWECQSLENVATDAIESSEPAWSPDGSLIAFTLGCIQSLCSTRDKADSRQIALKNLKTGAVTKLSSGHTPAWSPDGTRLVFAGTSDRPGLQIINIDGSGLTRITTNERDTAPSWR